MSQEDAAECLTRDSWTQGNIQLHNRLDAGQDSATGKPHSMVITAQVQTRHAWQVPAFFAIRPRQRESAEIE